MDASRSTTDRARRHIKACINKHHGTQSRMPGRSVLHRRKAVEDRSVSDVVTGHLISDTHRTTANLAQCNRPGLATSLKCQVHSGARICPRLASVSRQLVRRRFPGPRTLVHSMPPSVHPSEVPSQADTCQLRQIQTAFERMSRYPYEPSSHRAASCRG